MDFATESRRTQVLVWLIWAIACLIFIALPEQAVVSEGSVIGLPSLVGIVTHDSRNGPLFPWQPRHRWRKWAWRRYCALRQAHRRALWLAWLARLALTGASNKKTLENFACAARHISERPDPPLVVASTLLVPGYVDVEEVSKIASFIASFDPSIPYALLGFHPHFYMPDLPRTSVRHADEAEAAARAAGLTNVRIGNRHLLSRAY